MLPKAGAKVVRFCGLTKCFCGFFEENPQIIDNDMSFLSEYRDFD